MKRDDLNDAGDAVLVVAIGGWRHDALSGAFPRHSGEMFALARRGTAATCMAVAAVAHFAALPDHRGDGLTTSGFFLVVGFLQLTAAMALTRRSNRALRVAVVVGNLGVLGLWAWSRTLGLPLGSHAGMAEAVGPLDLAAAAAQVAAVAAVAFLPRMQSGVAILAGPTMGLAFVALMVAFGGASLVPSSSTDHSHGADHTRVTGRAPTHGHAPGRAAGAAAAHEAVAIDGAGAVLGDVPAPGDGGRGGVANPAQHDGGHAHPEPHPHPLVVASGPS